MKTLKLDLSNKVRPIVDVLINGEHILCLYDTGANISVWTGSINSFIALYKDAERVLQNHLISGFGGDGEYYDVYRVPSVTLSNGTDDYTIHNLFVAVGEEKDYGFKLLLSAGIFAKAKVILDNVDKSMTIESERGEYYMTLAVTDGSTTVFEQECEIVKSEPNIDNPLLRAAMRADIK